MFTGIVESVGQILDVKQVGSNRNFLIRSELASELKVDQSLAHEGVCLTVTECDKNSHWVTAIDETLKKSNLIDWTIGKPVNLERCMKADGRFDGHLVQGHVDTLATVASIENKEGSWLFRFNVESTDLMVEKGSVCLNGASLTCFAIASTKFSVAIIPYTYAHTTFGTLQVGDSVNIEFDILGKYIQKMIGQA